LCSWIYPPREPLAPNEALNFALGMRALGMSEEHVKSSLKLAQVKERGRPAAMRQVSIRALEIKQSDPLKSWMYIATKLCPCEKESHDVGCSEKLRQAVIDLKAFLKKHNTTVHGV